MQRHALPVLILALAVALPARASHTKSHTHPDAPAVAAASGPVEKRLASSKGARLVAQTPVAQPRDIKAKVAATKKAEAAKVAFTSTPAIPKPVVEGHLARITAYWTDEDYWTSHHMSSTGARLHEGNCAVDPKLIPYGSVVRIPGMGSYVAVDTGSAVVSRKAAVGAAQTPSQRNALVVDLFFENEKEAQEFAAHGPTFASVSWTKPATATDAPLDPKALPVEIPKAQPAYELASAPMWNESRMPLNFRTPQM